MKKDIMIKVRLMCLLVICLFCFGCGPESGDSRIIKNTDGTYTVQCYWRHPSWHGVGRGNSGTLEEARRLREKIDYTEPEVIEGVGQNEKQD